MLNTGMQIGKLVASTMLTAFTINIMIGGVKDFSKNTLGIKPGVGRTLANIAVTSILVIGGLIK